MTEDKRDQSPREYFGISERDEKELLKEIEHINVDYRYSDMTENEYISKLFPNIDNKEKLKVLFLTRMHYHWGH